MLLETFCKTVEQLYGKEKCTPNMHLHLHLKQCLIDFGPSHAFWCYSFKRCSGILGTFLTNNKSVEVQFMKKFIRSQLLQSIANDITDTELLGMFPSSYSTCTPISLTSFVTDDCQLILVLKLSHSQLLLEECSYKDIGLTKLQWNPS